MKSSLQITTQGGMDFIAPGAPVTTFPGDATKAMFGQVREFPEGCTSRVQR